MILFSANFPACWPLSAENAGLTALKANPAIARRIEKCISIPAFLHKGEEPYKRKAGSGTIFFAGCNLRCGFCQNYKFSHVLKGKIVTEPQLAQLMMALEAGGAHNINLVTPTHFLPQILKALLLCV